MRLAGLPPLLTPLESQEQWLRHLLLLVRSVIECLVAAERRQILIARCVVRIWMRLCRTARFLAMFRVACVLLQNRQRPTRLLHGTSRNSQAGSSANTGAVL